MNIRDVYLLERSEQFNLGPRQEVSVNLSLKRAPQKPCTLLIGRICGKNGPIEGAAVVALSRSYKPMMHTITDHRGNFVFKNNLPPGEYRIVATAEGYRVSRFYSLFIAHKRPVSMVIWLQASDMKNHATVYGIVYDEANSGLANADVNILNGNKPENRVAVTRTIADGQYLIYGLKPGKYWLSASKKGYFLPQKAWIELTANEIACMNLFVYPDGSSTDGTVSGKIENDGKSIFNAVAALYKAEDKGHILLATKETNESGFYLFPNVKPGKYTVESKMENDDGI